MKYRKIIIYTLILAFVVVALDMFRLSTSYRYYSWKLFTKNSTKTMKSKPSKPRVNVTPSGQGIFPDSPYFFTKGWHIHHISDWESHLKEFKDKPNVHALEIGSYEGFSAIWQLDNILTDPSSSITCIDIFEMEGIEERFDFNIAANGNSMAAKVIKVKGSSEIVLRDLDIEKFDYIYIDGSHMPKWVLSDAVLSWELLKPGGLIIFDDYNGIINPPKGFKLTRIGFLDTYIWNRYAMPRYSPKPAIDAFLKIYGPYLDVVYKQFQVVIRKKTKIPPSYW